MTKPIDALQMARHCGADVYGPNVDMTVMTLENLVSMVLERAATECEQSEAYRGSMFAQRIRALKPVTDKEEE